MFDLIDYFHIFCDIFIQSAVQKSEFRLLRNQFRIPRLPGFAPHQLLSANISRCFVDWAVQSSNAPVLEVFLKAVFSAVKILFTILVETTRTI